MVHKEIYVKISKREIVAKDKERDKMNGANANKERRVDERTKERRGPDRGRENLASTSSNANFFSYS